MCTVAYNQKSLNKLVEEGLNGNNPKKTRIKALQSAAELMTNSKPDSSIILLDLANKLNEKVGELTSQQANHLIRAKTLLIQGVYPIALEFAQKALKISEGFKDKKLIADCYSVIGQIYERQENNEKAAEYQLKGLKINRALNDSVRISASLSLLGNIYGAKLEYEAALQSYRESLKYINEEKNREQVGIAYGNIGYVYYEQGKAVKETDPKNAATYLNKALEASKKAKEIFLEIKNRRFQIIAELNIGLVYN